MPVRSYLAIADLDDASGNWSIVFSDFPGVTSVAGKAADILRQARDALATAVEDMEEEGETLPPSMEDGVMGAFNREDFTDPRLCMIPVETSSRAVRINMSMDEALLGRLDEISRHTGMPHSALLARGARMVIASEREM